MRYWKIVDAVYDIVLERWLKMKSNRLVVEK